MIICYFCKKQYSELDIELKDRALDWKHCKDEIEKPFEMRLIDNYSWRYGHNSNKPIVKELNQWISNDNWTVDLRSAIENEDKY